MECCGQWLTVKRPPLETTSYCSPSVCQDIMIDPDHPDPPKTIEVTIQYVGVHVAQAYKNSWFGGQQKYNTSLIRFLSLSPWVFIRFAFSVITPVLYISHQTTSESKSTTLFS
ncbi:hypothetical protein PTI98_004218 [Pleurotus ostreatus]|nr:hypothetical protein PTI98_004218 [Pleurotus ostreatus]